MRSRSRTALVAALLAASFAAPLHAADLFVPGDHPTIQAAIDAAVSGDTIHVAAGTWPGALVIAEKKLVLDGEGADVTIVDGLGAAQTLFATSPALDGVEVSDMTIMGGVTGVEGVLAASVSLKFCTVRDNSGVGITGRVGAISCTLRDNGSHGADNFLQLAQWTLQGNGGWGAIDVDNGFPSSPSAIGSRFLGNGLGGLRLAITSPTPLFPPKLSVTHCTFLGDTLQLSAQESTGTGESLVYRCSFQDSTIKIMQGQLYVQSSILWSDEPVTDLVSPPSIKQVTWSDVKGGWSGTGLSNIDADPLFTDAADGDFSLQPGSPCINTASPEFFPDPDGSPTDMGAVTYHPWTDLGGGVAGTPGPSRLSGIGPLLEGEVVGFELDTALPGAAALLIVGLSELGAPFKGGTLWPDADAILGPFAIDPDGELAVSGPWPAGPASGFTFWSQTWWADAGAVQGWASSNGVKGVQP